jgi:hypothetical protein
MKVKSILIMKVLLHLIEVGALGEVLGARNFVQKLEKVRMIGNFQWITCDILVF